MERQANIVYTQDWLPNQEGPMQNKNSGALVQIIKYFKRVSTKH